MRSSAEPRPAHAQQRGAQGRPANMATYVEIVKNEFPEIDSEVFAYITGESAGVEASSEQNRTAGPWNFKHRGASLMGLVRF